MENARLTGRTILIVETDVERAAPMQDMIVHAGCKVLTAHSLSRALLIACNADLDDALIDFQFDGADTVGQILTARRVPYIFYCSEGLCCSSASAAIIHSARSPARSAPQFIGAL